MNTSRTVTEIDFELTYRSSTSLSSAEFAFRLTSSITSLIGRPDCRIWAANASVMGHSMLAVASPAVLPASNEGVGDCDVLDVLWFWNDSEPLFRLLLIMSGASGRTMYCFMPTICKGKCNGDPSVICCGKTQLQFTSAALNGLINTVHHAESSQSVFVKQEIEKETSPLYHSQRKAQEGTR